MKTRKLLFYLLAVLMGGCVPVFSLHPLYTKETVILKQELLGTWVHVNDPNMTWDFKRAEEPNAYKLIYTGEPGKRGSFITHLVKLKDQLFLDVYPDAMPCDIEDPNKLDWQYNSFFIVPVHTFLKVDSIEPVLKMRLTDDELMKKLLERDPNAIKHTLLDEVRYVLTGSTKELQDLVTKYGDGDRLFRTEDPIILNRAKAKGPQKSEDKKSGDQTNK